MKTKVIALSIVFGLSIASYALAKKPVLQTQWNKFYFSKTEKKVTVIPFFVTQKDAEIYLKRLGKKSCRNCSVANPVTGLWAIYRGGKIEDKD